MTAQEFGYDVMGLDIREDNVKAMQNLGYPTSCIQLEKYTGITPAETFNVISLMDVLEHIPFPTVALSAAIRLLKPDGALIVSCPNMDSAIWRALDNTGKNPYWTEIEHYHNFTRESMALLLEAHGLSPISYHVSHRYRACMEIIAMKTDAQ